MSSWTLTICNKTIWRTLYLTQTKFNAHINLILSSTRLYIVHPQKNSLPRRSSHTTEHISSKKLPSQKNGPTSWETMEVDHHLAKSWNAPWIFCHRVNKNICRSVANEFGKFLPRRSAERAGGVGDTLVCVSGRGDAGSYNAGLIVASGRRLSYTVFLCLHPVYK